MFKNWFAATEGYVKKAAFMPAPRTNDVSLYRTRGLIPKQVWRLGDRRITHNFYGVAELTKQHIFKSDLSVSPDRIPRRHVTIAGWPPKSDKARQKLLAQQLATCAKLKLRSQQS